MYSVWFGLRPITHVICTLVAILLSLAIFNKAYLYSFLSLDIKQPINPVSSSESCTNQLIIQSVASSVWCFNRIDGSKLCHFQNLYFSSKCEECIFFLLNNFSTISGIESAEMLKYINLSSIKNHTGMNLKINIETSCSRLLKENFQIIEKEAILMKRFKPDNLMHVIHDDIFPLFTTYDELCHGNIRRCLSIYQLIFLDNNDEGPYHAWYEQMTKVPLMSIKHMTGKCLKNSIIGISHSSAWYQYGFKSVQGPMDNKQLNGLKLRKFTTFIKEQFNISVTNVRLPNTVVFLSRNINRKILNEITVEENIIKVYEDVEKKSVKIIKTDITDNFRELITIIQGTNLLIGMHGSAMILAIFLPQGSKILELFPFGIQPEFVSPIKALCSLPDVNYNYKAWVNTNETNTRVHPEYHQLLGGISHLSLSDQERISKIKLVPPMECCHDPLYLYRMFQDTVVDDSFNSLLFELISAGKNLPNEDFKRQSLEYVYRTWYFPAPVFNISCKCVQNHLHFTWDYPFLPLESVKFSLATSFGIAAIVDVLEFKSEIKCYSDNSLQDKLQKREVSLWVKAVMEDKSSVDRHSLCGFYSLKSL